MQIPALSQKAEINTYIVKVRVKVREEEKVREIFLFHIV